MTGPSCDQFDKALCASLEDTLQRDQADNVAMYAVLQNMLWCEIATAEGIYTAICEAAVIQKLK